MREKEKLIIQNIVIFGIIVVFIIAFLLFPYQRGETTSSLVNIGSIENGNVLIRELIYLNYN